MDYIVDEVRRDLVLDAILDQYRRGGYPYNLKRTMLSVLELPKRMRRGGEAEARFWLFSCMLMRGGINTDTALRALSRMYEREMIRGGAQPFNPMQAKDLTPDAMTGLLQEAGTGLYRIARDWINVAGLVARKFDGCVMNLVSEVHDYRSALDLLLEFPGFRHKMVSMFLFFTTETGLVPYFDYPPPVDFHLKRVPIETFVVTRRDNHPILAYLNREHDQLEEVLRDMYFDYLTGRNIRSNELADAVWLLSRMMCRWNPGNTSYVAKDRDGTRTSITMHGANFSTRRDVRKYERSCARCVIEHLCVGNVPANPYYVRRELGIFGERRRSPIAPLDPQIVDGTKPPPPRVTKFQQPTPPKHNLAQKTLFPD